MVLITCEEGVWEGWEIEIFDITKLEECVDEERLEVSQGGHVRVWCRCE